MEETSKLLPLTPARRTKRTRRRMPRVRRPSTLEIPK